MILLGIGDVMAKMLLGARKCHLILTVGYSPFIWANTVLYVWPGARYDLHEAVESPVKEKAKKGGIIDVVQKATSRIRLHRFAESARLENTDYGEKETTMSAINTAGGFKCRRDRNARRRYAARRPSDKITRSRRRDKPKGQRLPEAPFTMLSNA